MSLRIYVDFNTMTMDARERVAINTEVRQYPTAQLRPRLRVVLFDEEMEVEGTVEFDTEHQQWLAQPDWTTRLDLPSPGKPASKVA